MNKPLLIGLVALIVAAACSATYLITRHAQEKRFSDAVSAQKDLRQIEAANTLDYTANGNTIQYNYNSDTVFNYGDGSSIGISYPTGLYADTENVIETSITLHPRLESSVNAKSAVNGGYLAVLPDDEPMTTPDAYQKQLQTDYAESPQPHQKFFTDIFVPDLSKPLPDGFQTSKVGQYTCYYFNAEEENPAYRLCHIFGKNHVVDIAYATHIQAGEFGPGTPTFDTNDAEKIIGTLYYNAPANQVPAQSL